MRRSARYGHSRTLSFLKAGIWDNNPIFISVLGLCSSLAVTTQTKQALIMGLCVIGVMVVSAPIISFFKYFISDHLRMVLYMLIIATLVIVVDLGLKIYLPDMSRSLGPYVGLIITNCIIMGRIEAFAVKNSFGKSFLDALGTGIGYTAVIVFVASVREILGSGTFWGIAVLGEGVYTWGLFAIAPGAFFVLGGLTLLFNWLRSDGRRVGEWS